MTRNTQSTTVRTPAQARLPRAAIRYDAAASRADDRLVYRVASRTQPGTTYTVTFTFADGVWRCDCLAGEYGKRCVHRTSVVHHRMVDDALAWLRRCDPAALADYTRRVAEATAGRRAGWLGLAADAEALALLAAERTPVAS